MIDIDHFKVLNDSFGLLACAERIRTAIGAGAFRTQDDLVFDVTISIGCALDWSLFFLPDDLLRAADAALYSSKNLGRNCTTIWSQRPCA